MVAGTGRIRTTVEAVHEATMPVSFEDAEKIHAVMVQVVEGAGSSAPILISHEDGKLVFTAVLRESFSNDDLLTRREVAMTRAHTILAQLERDPDHDEKLRLRIRDARVALQNGAD